MHISTTSLQAFKSWKGALLKTYLNQTIIKAGYAPCATLYNRIGVKPLAHALFIQKAYYLDHGSPNEQLLFTTILLLNENETPVLVIEWPNGKKETHTFTP